MLMIDEPSLEFMQDREVIGPADSQLISLCPITFALTEMLVKIPHLLRSVHLLSLSQNDC